VKSELLQHEIQVEELGGDVLTVEVSALRESGSTSWKRRSSCNPKCSI